MRRWVCKDGVCRHLCCRKRGSACKDGLAVSMLRHSYLITCGKESLESFGVQALVLLQKELRLRAQQLMGCLPA